MPQGPSSPRSYYEILGVAPTATANEIKAAYRKLARTMHPDVNPNDPHASQKFAEVTAAYKTLSDSLSRANYDAEAALKARREQTARNRSGGAASSASYATQTPRAGAARQTPPTQSSSNTGDEVVRLINDARAALSRMRFVEARDLAQRALRIKRTAEGYEVLGDVYRLQGKTEDAINMYTMALQLNPRNSMIMDRLQRLARGSGGNNRRYDVRSDSPYPSPGGAPPPPRSSGGASAYPEYTARPGAVGANVLPEKRPLLKMFAVVMGFGTTVLLLAALALFMHDAPLRNGPIPLEIVSKWSGGLVSVLIGCGMAAGATMSITGILRRLEDELVFSRAESGFVPPMGPVLLLLSAISFWAAAILHLLLSALQEARVTGILRAFVAVVVIVLLAGICYDDAGRGQVFLWGGNVVFLSLIFGWFVGDLFRTD